MPAASEARETSANLVNRMSHLLQNMVCFGQNLPRGNAFTRKKLNPWYSGVVNDWTKAQTKGCLDGNLLSNCKQCGGLNFSDSPSQDAENAEIIEIHHLSMSFTHWVAPKAMKRWTDLQSMCLSDLVGCWLAIGCLVGYFASRAQKLH